MFKRISAAIVVVMGCYTATVRGDSGVGRAFADLDARDYRLTVTSSYGEPCPAVGSHSNYCWGSTVSCSVEQVAYDGSYWTCIGWSGTGSVPAEGTAVDTGSFTLTNLESAITWNWERLAYMITVSAGEHGQVVPSGQVSVYAGETLELTITPDEYYQVVDVLTNDVETGTTGVSSFSWSQVMDDGSVDVQFGALTTVSNTPLWWLAGYSITQQVEQAALQDQDGDGAAAWQEYVMDTSPVDSESCLSVSIDYVATGTRLQWPVSSNRIYQVCADSSLDDGPIVNSSWDHIAPLESGTCCITDTLHQAGQRMNYRVKVMLPDSH